MILRKSVLNKDNKEDVSSNQEAPVQIDDSSEIKEDVAVVGQVSEILGEKGETFTPGKKDGAKKDNTSPQQSSQKINRDLNAIKTELLKTVPKSESVLRKTIERKIQKEINSLHKEAMKMVNSANKANYFEMTNIVRKIRELKGILAQLAKMTYENLKVLWLRYIHGIM